MQNESLTVSGQTLPLTRVHTLVIGSGAAGLNAAVQLRANGVEDVAIVRLEQFYPYPGDTLSALLRTYASAEADRAAADQGDGDPRHARLAGILHPVGIVVKPDAVTQGGRLRDIAEVSVEEDFTRAEVDRAADRLVEEAMRLRAVSRRI